MSRALVTARALLATAAVLLAATAGAQPPDVRRVSPAELSAELAALRNHVVMLNVWATWCAPCLKEIPDLLAVEDELRNAGLVLLGLAIDDPADAAQVADFRDRYFPAFHTLQRGEGDADALVSVIDPAWNEVVPTTYLLGRDGRTLRRIQGKLTREAFRKAAGEALGASRQPATTPAS